MNTSLQHAVKNIGDAVGQSTNYLALSSVTVDTYAARSTQQFLTANRWQQFLAMFAIRNLTFVLIMASSLCLKAQDKMTLTDSLVNKFHEAWNSNDLDAMISMLHPDAFFNSPYQLRYTRDTMAATVLIWNPLRIKDCTTTEVYSHVENNLAWSIGYLYCNRYDSDGVLRKKLVDREQEMMRFEIYDDEGNWIKNEEEGATEYTYIFTRDKEGNWKIKVLFYHEGD